MFRRESQLAHDPTAPIECHDVDNRFIPLRVCDLARVLGEDCGRLGLDPLLCGQVVAAISAVIEQEAASFHRDLDNQYSFFNPDRETLPLDADADARRPAGYSSLIRRLEYLLDKANFEPLDDVAVDRAIQVASSYGFKVQLDPQRIEDFAVFVRGTGTVQRQRRCWRAPIKGRVDTLPVYRRLVVIARLKDDPHVLLKMFKDIPEEDVECLLPHAQITMNWIDRLFMIGGGAGAMGSTAAQVVKILSAGLLAISRLLWVILFGGSVIIWRTFTGYNTARQRRDAQRTRHLYFQNVSNNAGTVHMLVSMTAQEEIKEAMAAYLLCASSRVPTASAGELRITAEAYLRDRFGVSVDFDVTDAIATLERLGLWQDRERFTVLSPADALARLNDHWLHRRSEGHHSRCAARETTPG